MNSQFHIIYQTKANSEKVNETTQYQDLNLNNKDLNDILNKNKTNSQKLKMQLESVFQVYPNPCADLKAALAKDLNMDPRKLQVWFQNRRAKERSLSKRGSPQSNPNECPSGPNINGTEICTNTRLDKSPSSPNLFELSEGSLTEIFSSPDKRFKSAPSPRNPMNILNLID